jgi:hypothetical protein
MAARLGVSEKTVYNFLTVGGAIQIAYRGVEDCQIAHRLRQEPCRSRHPPWN